MNIAELFKKNFILVPVIASVLVGTFTGVRYIVNLTDTINDNQNSNNKSSKRFNYSFTRKTYRSKHKINFCRIYVADGRESCTDNSLIKLREHSYDIKDLNR